MIARPDQAGRQGVGLVGAGHAAPQRAIPNAWLEDRLGLETGWIERRTGIRERRWAENHETLSDLAAAAGRMALERAGLQRSEVGLLLLATSTPDHLLPPSAPLVAHKLGLEATGAIDLAGACAGFLYALTLGESYVRTHKRPVMVIAANLLSRRINTEDTSTAVLFADAAGAVVLAPVPNADRGIQAVHLTTDGANYDLIHIPAGGSNRPFGPELEPSDTRMHMRDGRAVYQKAVTMMAVACRAALSESGLSAGDVDHFIPHQANARMIETLRQDLDISASKTATTITDFGNSSAATLPFTLSFLYAKRGFRSGQRVLLCAAGAGLNGGAVVLSL